MQLLSLIPTILINSPRVHRHLPHSPQSIPTLFKIYESHDVVIKPFQSDTYTWLVQWQHL